MKYCGIDLHSNNSVISVIDEEDRVLAETRLANDLEMIIGLMKPWQAELAGVEVESTFNWYWLVDGLKAAGFTSLGQHHCNQEIRRTQAQRRRSRCALLGPSATTQAPCQLHAHIGHAYRSRRSPPWKTLDR